MQPKKSLGQNFLRDEEVLEKIILSADLKSDDFVIEIGPGEGALTEKLLRATNHLICVEKDDELALKLDSRFRGNDKIKIINDDILEINLPELLKVETRQCLVSTDDTITYKVVANIPYYITSPIIQLFLETEFPPSEMILMVQREVAERICAKQGQMSLLAVSVQYYAKPELLFYVSKKSFYPVPEVDSAVIKISVNKEQETANKKGNTRKFFQIVKAGFSAKRKMLLNNLSNSLHLKKKEVAEILQKAGIQPTQRAQELSVEDWKKLSQLF